MVGGGVVGIGYVARIDVDEHLDLEGICVQEVMADLLCNSTTFTN